MPRHYGHLIRTLYRCTDQAMTAALEKMGLTAAQGRIMGYLSCQKKPLCAKDLEDAFHLTHPTVSGILSRLEQKDFIRLQTDPTDRRCKRIYIQPRGMECHQTMLQAIQSNESRLVEGFTPEEQELFSALLHRAIANIGGTPCQTYTKEESQQ